MFRNQKEAIVKQFFVVFLIAGFLSGCAAPPSSRPLAPTDMILGAYLASESSLRVKVACTVPSVNGWSFILPIGEYTAKSADSEGVFYEAPTAVSYESESKKLPMTGGVHIPSEVRPGATFSLWVLEAHPSERKIAPNRVRPLPQQCWQPYGSAMALVRNGVEIPSPTSTK